MAFPRLALMYSVSVMPSSLGQAKPKVKDFLNEHVYSALNMKSHRKALLAQLLVTRYNDDRGKLIAESGLTKGRISQMLKSGFGEVAARELEDKLDLPSLWFEQRDIANTSPAPAVQGEVPLISWKQAGSWNESSGPSAPGDAEAWVQSMKPHSASAYALRVRGDSMTSPYGKSYPAGSIIIVEPERRSPINGERIIAKLEGSDEVTFKVYKEEDARRWLQPLNPTHEPIREPFTVLGTIIGKWEDE